MWRPHQRLQLIEEITPDATLVKIAARTGLDKKTVSSLIRQAAEQAHVRIEKTGPVYAIAEWGPIIKKSGAKKALTGALNAPQYGGIETRLRKDHAPGRPLCR